MPAIGLYGSANFTAFRAESATFSSIIRTPLVTGADSADHGRSGVDAMSVLPFPVTGADSDDHECSGVDGISLSTFPVTGADSPVQDYFGDDGISLPKFVFADASCHLFGN